MPFNRDEVFEQAMNDGFASVVSTPDYEAKMLYGIKITRPCRINESAVIYNTQKGGDHYEEISSADYNLFAYGGWRYGVYVLSLSNCRTKIDKLNEAIKLEEVREPKRQKYKESILKQLDTAHTRYLKIEEKLNQIKSINHGTSQE